MVLSRGLQHGRSSVITRRNLLNSMLPALVGGGTAMAGEWSKSYQAQLKAEAERRRRIRQQRQRRWEALQRSLAEERARDRREREEKKVDGK
jgi:hypothetical protein